MFVWKLQYIIEDDSRDVLTLQMFESIEKTNTSQALMQNNVIII